MPEEIFVTCVYCKKTFNVEWQGFEIVQNKTGVCGKKECIEQHQERDTRHTGNPKEKMEGY